ncbi:MAG: hypothetical protein WAZ77_19065, partial [Candidatus Nitrosopolaris sp.]
GAVIKMQPIGQIIFEILPLDKINEKHTDCINLNLIKFSSQIHTSKRLPYFCSKTDYSVSSTLASSLDTCVNALNLMLRYLDVTLL